MLWRMNHAFWSDECHPKSKTKPRGLSHHATARNTRYWPVGESEPFQDDIMKDVDPGEYGAAWPKLGANFRPSRIPVEQQRVDPHYFAIQMKSFPIYTKVYV